MLTAVAFLIAYLTGCLLALARHPIFGLITYVALVYVHPPSTWWGDRIPSLRWSLIAAGITLLATLIHRSKEGGARLMNSGLVTGGIVFVTWLAVQYFWALEKSIHLDLIVLNAKYVLLVILINLSIDSEARLKQFLWAHAAGCFYLGTVVLSDYLGGRFEGFRGPGINEANAAALLIVTGVVTTFVLFLSGRKLEKAFAFGFMPVTLNGLVATISRSGFLALAVAGLVFNMFVSIRSRRIVRFLSVVGLLLLLAIANPVFWERIDTIRHVGEEVSGIDTGSRRLVLLKAQFEMFKEYPLGCGHRCTATLSPFYLEGRYLTGGTGEGARSSHNTFMTLLVEQGIPGAIMYILLLYWMAKLALRLRKKMRDSVGLIPNTYTATVAILCAITVGDLFVDYLKFEARVWFLALLMVTARFATAEPPGECDTAKSETGLGSRKALSDDYGKS